MILSYDKETADALRSAHPDVLAEIVRQAELRLQHSAHTALFRDQRNMTTGLAFGAFASGGVGAAVAGVGLDVPSMGLAVAGGIFGVTMFIASMIALWQARPRRYFTPGNTPKMWVADIVEGFTLHDGLADTAGVYEAAISSNEGLATVQSTALLVSWIIAGVGTLSAAVVGLSLAGV